MDTSEILSILQMGDMDVEGLLPWSSNYTFLVNLCTESQELAAIYKPQRGERPLWDVSQGTLYLRERTAFVISSAIGWDLVPPTIVRQGPNGVGSVQLFIDHDPERHYFTFEGEEAYKTELQKIVLLDILINNADRKAGHLLLGKVQDNHFGLERLWGIDHGVCFHAEYKLRTVIWEFAGMPIPAVRLQELTQFQQKLSINTSDLRIQLQELLAENEIVALQNRLSILLNQAQFPTPGPGRHYPWPPV